MVQSKKKKRKADSRSVEPGSVTIDSTQKKPWTAFVIASIVLAVILIIVGIGYYQNYVVPFRQVILSVDGTPIRMDYFLKRTELAGGDPMGMLQSLTDEELIKHGAPRYGIEATPEDIDQELRI